MTARGRWARAAVLPSWWLVLLLLVVAAGWCLVHPLASTWGAWENDLSRGIADRRTGWATVVAQALTVPGNTPVVLGIGVVLVVLAAWRREWVVAAYVAVGLGGVYGLYVLAFTLVHRDRPPVEILDPGLVPDHSFPSGHVAGSVLLYGAIAALLRRRYPARARPLLVLLAVIPVGVLLSRLYLGAHHLSDLAVAYLFASAWLWALDRWVLSGIPDGRAGRQAPSRV